MMLHFLLVGLGGALGAMLRHGTNLLALRWLGPDFPYGTMAINITGSILIGIVAGLLAHVTQWTQELRLFAVVGILGGYTTFSAYSLDSFLLLERGDYMQAAIYMGGTVILSLVAVFIGMALMRGIAG
ncbi:MAG: fluoride efflux transporter CrcB [Pseudobdellovibrionaceae bacterium]